MILSPFTAYRLAAQAERAIADRDYYRTSAAGIAREANRLRADLAAANAKIARMTSGLRRGASKA